MPLWITVDCELGAHPKMAALPNDSARYGWILTLTSAKKQRTPGSFASAKHFRLVMGRHGRFLKDYTAAKLLDEGPDGTLHVHDWQRHQWAVSKSQQRETSDGLPQDKNETSDGPKEDASRAVPVPVSVAVDGERNQEDRAHPKVATDDALDTYYALTTRYPAGRVKEWLTEIANEFGHREAGIALAKEHMASADLRTLLSRTEGHLRSVAHHAEVERAKPKTRARETPEAAAKRDRDRAEIVREWTAQVKDVPA